MNRFSLLLVGRRPTRVGIRMALGYDIGICAEADDAEQAIRLAKRLEPDLSLVARDVAGDYLAAVRGICRAAARMRSGDGG